ncbi:hypothetical protein L207DRAFT_518308 [Hyaloscypha variabilis F]|uniref:Uncharacterized protein n=1 Tax=Hyaloscypha variabilis (strain UAMH 11265 / GT02V1 / F) TaxID=1149755 RepID=A0A2J6R2Z1_HYAVF|nr:hypothetical protein L207DRAFT_518308 [Hyaloscypha variabilis F]
MVAVNGPILDSILALQNGYNGAISLFPGPRYCQQVACTEAAALYACNDVSFLFPNHTHLLSFA